jgi:hypothetical protein
MKQPANNEPLVPVKFYACVYAKWVLERVVERDDLTLNAPRVKCTCKGYGFVHSFCFALAIHWHRHSVQKSADLAGSTLPSSWKMNEFAATGDRRYAKNPAFAGGAD